MLKRKKIALTGSLASGKTLASRYFKDLGAYVVNADEIVHHLLTPKTDLGKKIVKLLGEDVVVKNEFDRTRIAKKVFLHPKLLRSLENILHPRAYEEIEREYDNYQKQKNPPLLFLAEIPLLFETEGQRFFDTTITVVADQEKCWDRYRKQTGYEREEFNRRMARQLPQHVKAAKSDFIINNNGTEKELKKSIEQIYKDLSTSEKKPV